MARDQIYDIVARVRGEEEVRRLTEEIKKLEEAIRGTNNQQIAEGFARQIAAKTQQLDGVNRKLKEVSGGQRDLGRAAQEAGYAVQDFASATGDIGQRLNAISNNLPGLVQALGGGVGLATALGVAASAVGILIRNWDTLMQSMNSNAIKTAAEQVEELEKKTKRTADEQERLNRLKREQKQGEAGNERPEEEQRANKEAVQAVIDAGGTDKVAEALMTQRGGVKYTPEEEKHLQQLRRGELPDELVDAQSLGEWFDTTVKRKIEEIEEGAKSRSLGEARRNLEQAMDAGPDNELMKNSVANELQKNPFQPLQDLGKKLAGTTVESMKEMDEIDRNFEQLEESNKRYIDAKRERLKREREAAKEEEQAQKALKAARMKQLKESFTDDQIENAGFMHPRQGLMLNPAAIGGQMMEELVATEKRRLGLRKDQDLPKENEQAIFQVVNERLREFQDDRDNDRKRNFGEDLQKQPGWMEQAKKAALRYTMITGNDAASNELVRSQVRDKLKAANPNMDEQRLDVEARRITKETFEALDKDIVDQVLNPDKEDQRQEHTPGAVTGIREFSNRLQESALNNDDIPRRSLDVQEQMLKVLIDMRPDLVARLVPQWQ